MKLFILKNASYDEILVAANDEVEARKIVRKTEPDKPYYDYWLNSKLSECKEIGIAYQNEPEYLMWSGQ